METISTRCAVVNADNVAVNLIIADPAGLAPDGCILIEVQPGQNFDIGWIWDGSIFVNPNDTGGNP